MKYEIKFTSQFKKDFKRLQRRRADLTCLQTAVEILANGDPLPPEYRDHALIGNYQGVRECHIRPDWLLIYKINENVLVLELLRTGSHSDLFR